MYYLRYLFLSVFLITCVSPKNITPVYSNTRDKSYSLSENIRKLSNQIFQTMIEEKKSKVAVFAFPTIDGDITRLGLYLADKLTNSLFQFQNKFEVVDRFHLEDVLKEMEMGQSGIQDPKTIREIGKILGADAIVTGMITDLGTKLDINLRLLDTEKAKVLAVASTMVKKDKMVESLMVVVRGIRLPSGTKSKSYTPEVEIKNLYSGDGKNIIVGGKIRPGALFWNDRKYRIVKIPKKYVGLKYIQTACDSKRSPVYTEYAFQVNQPVWLYVIWDERVPFPQWIKEGFENTGDSVQIQGQRRHNYLILKSIRPFPEGTIKTYGQEPSDNSFYVIMVGPA